MVIGSNVEKIPALIYRPDSISMVTFVLTDAAGNSLKRLEREAIGDTIRYEVPCGVSDSTLSLHIRYTVPFGVVDRFDDVYAVGNGGGISGIVTQVEGDSCHLKVEMLRGRRTTFSLRLHSAVTGQEKRYTVALERKFELFDVINEHIGHLRVVHNNPAINKHGMKFSACEWHYKPDSGEWEASSFTRLYFLAGASHLTKFPDTDYDFMYVVLYTVDGDRFASCPDISHPKSGNEEEEVSGSSKSAVSVSVYPNPVPAGGIIRIKEVEFFDGDDELYAKFYLLDAQGRPVLTGSASALRSGLTMPETPGIYHLVLEGKAGRKVVKVAVGQKKF